MAVTQYIGARYVPVFADPVDWNNTRTYEPLTIVLYQGDSYTSAQYVPKGIDITNEDFWKRTGSYNAQVEQYRKDVTTFRGYVDSAVDKMETDLSTTKSDINTEITALTSTVNNEISRAISSENSMYNYLKLGFVIPEMFGAIGDGVTDDTVAIQSMVDSYDNCLFLNKTYATKEIILRNGVSYRLIGDNATLLNINNILDVKTDSKKGFYTLTNRNRIYGPKETQFIELSGITFDFNKKKDITKIPHGTTASTYINYGTNVCLHMYNRVIIDNCRFINSLQDNLSLNGCNSISVTNCYFYNSGSNEISDWSFGGTNNHCTFYRYSFNDETSAQVFAGNHENVYVCNNTFDTVKDEAIRCDEYQNVTVDSNTFINTHQHIFENFLNKAVEFNLSNININITNNTISYLGSHVYACSGALPSAYTGALNCNVSNNSINHLGGYASVDKSRGGLALGTFWFGKNELVKVVVDGNIVNMTNAYYPATTTDNDIALVSFYCGQASFTNNVIKTDDSSLDGSYQSHYYFVKIFSCATAIIENNTFFGTGTMYTSIVCNGTRRFYVKNNYMYLSPTFFINCITSVTSTGSIYDFENNIAFAGRMFSIDIDSSRDYFTITGNKQMNSDGTFMYKNTKGYYVFLSGNSTIGSLGTFNTGAITKCYNINNTWN